VENMLVIKEYPTNGPYKKTLSKFKPGQKDKTEKEESRELINRTPT